MEIFTETVLKKRKRYNKNKKKAWRKKINIADIEEHLDEKRYEERLEGLEERESSEFFSLDLEDEEKSLNFKCKRAKFSSNDDGLKPLFNEIPKKVLRCHGFLNGLPGAKAISVKRKPMKQTEKRVIKNARKLALATPKAVAMKKSLLRQRKIDLKRKCKTQIPNFNQNLWKSSSDVEGKFNEVSKSFLAEPVLFYKVQTKQAKVKTPAIRYEKPSLLPSVIIPKAGASYNPSYDDHQKLLAEALEFENAKEKKEEKKRKMREKYTLPKIGITEMEKIAEMSEGLPLNREQDYEMFNHSDEDENNEDDHVYVANKKIEKKSLQSRKKAKTVKIKEQKRLNMKMRKIRENDIDRVKSLQRKINKEEEEEFKRLAELKRKKKFNDNFRTKKLSRYQFEDDGEVVSLGNELADSLRSVQPLGNPLESVFKSFQRRNIIEKRVKVRKTKGKKKMITKKSCKEPLNLLND